MIIIIKIIIIIIIITTRSMQGMFGVSVSELYLLIKLLINIERTDLCDHKNRNKHAYTGNVSEAWL